MIQNLVCEYEDGIQPGKEREASFVNSVQMWLRPFSQEINLQSGKVVVYFSKEGANMFRLEGIDSLMQQKITKQFVDFML